MRRPRESQLYWVPDPVDHTHAKELAAMGRLLDSFPQLDQLVLDDLAAGRRTDVGAPGMSGAQVLRVGLLKQLRGFTYDELAFHLLDSASYRAFCGFGWAQRTPRRATLQQNLARVRPETWEKINRALVTHAVDEGIERCERMRSDSTDVDAHLLEPTDSGLLWDVVRVLTRLLKRAAQRVPNLAFSDHTRAAKKRLVRITYARHKADRKRPYRRLIRTAQDVTGYVRDALPQLRNQAKLHARMSHFVELGERVVDQARRRVLHGEKVPASEKIVSIFEEHAAILWKGLRDVHYGHRVSFTTGATALIVDCVIEDGARNDSSTTVRNVERFVEITGRMPEQAAFDGGYASKANLAAVKALGVTDVAFNKKVGLKVPEMVRESWMYRALWRYRVGVESVISLLKRCFGLRACTWKGEAGFQAYVWSAVVAYNVLFLARAQLE